MSDLPRYSEDELNSLKILEIQSKILSDAYSSMSQAITNLIVQHKNYHEESRIKNLKSNYHSYQAALHNYEGIKALIEEIKDDFHSTGLTDWLP
jgi:hypothetical protein